MQFSRLFADGGHADVGRRPLPGPPGQVRRRQHGRQQRRLLRHSRTGPSSAGTTSMAWTRASTRGPWRASFERLREWLPVYSQDGQQTPAAGRDKDGRGHRGSSGSTVANGVVDANIKDCLGSGYCNIGCAYGKKLSALDNILPRAQRDFPASGLRIFSECLAEHIETRGRRATEVVCRLSDGRRLRVAANTVVVSGGALASSLLLQRSGLGGKLAGTGLSFNVGRASHSRLRGEAQLIRRPSDHPRLPAAGRGAARSSSPGSTRSAHRR